MKKMKKLNVKVTEFAKRHWEKDFGGTKITNITVEEFEKYMPALCFSSDQVGVYCNTGKAYAGYADFCTLVCVENFTNARTGSLEITLENHQYLRSGYHSRRDEELAVLSRWFELPLRVPVAKYLMLVLYTREQLEKEWKESNESNKGFRNCIGLEPKPDPNVDYGIVSVLAQMVDVEEPMKPATMIRNALGPKEGGSGVPIDREQYNRSVEFWKTHATVKSK